jgi:hypothetical protein
MGITIAISPVLPSSVANGDEYAMNVRPTEDMFDDLSVMVGKRTSENSGFPGCIGSHTPPFQLRDSMAPRRSVQYVGTRIKMHLFRCGPAGDERRLSVDFGLQKRQTSAKLGGVAYAMEWARRRKAWYLC